MFIPNRPALQTVPIDELRLSLNPVRRHPAKEIRKTAELIARHGQVVPIITAPDGEIIHGEAIWCAQKKRGVSEVEVLVIPGKSPVELRELQLALNRIPLDGTWHRPNVRAALMEVAGLPLDLQLTGFDVLEIHDLQEVVLNSDAGTSDVPPLQDVAVSTPGTVWSLDNHRVGHGSPTDAVFLAALLSGQTAGAAFVDIPYDRERLSENHRPHQGVTDDVIDAGAPKYAALVDNILLAIKQHCDPTGVIFAGADKCFLMEILAAGRHCDLPLHHIVTALMSSASNGPIYKCAHDLICVFGASSTLSADPGAKRRRRHKTDVWRSSGESVVRNSRAQSHSAWSYMLIANALRDVTRRGDLVLDTVLGPGSTLIAAEVTGRICYGAESNPLLLDCAVRRWEQKTGHRAISLQTGEPFADAAKRKSLPSGEPYHAD